MAGHSSSSSRRPPSRRGPSRSPATSRTFPPPSPPAPTALPLSRTRGPHSVHVPAVPESYLALNVAYLFVLGSPGVAHSELVAADTARALLGERGADLAAGMVALATLGGLNGNILGGARVFYAMANAGVFWRPAGRVHERFGTPAVALAVQGAVSMAFVLTGRFDQLIASSLFASWLF